jgi:hypothetical protein
MALDDWDDHTSLVYSVENAILSMDDLLGVVESDTPDLDDADRLIGHLQGVIGWYYRVYGRRTPPKEKVNPFRKNRPGYGKSKGR